MDLKEKILVALGINEEEVKLGWQGKSEDGTIFVSTAEEADVGDWAGMEKRIENLEIAVAKLKEDKEGGDDESEEMSEEVVEPSTNPKSIKTTEVKEFSEELKELKAENEKLKTELAETPGDAPINTNKFSADRKPVSKVQYSKMSKNEKFLHNLYN